MRQRSFASRSLGLALAALLLAGGGGCSKSGSGGSPALGLEWVPADGPGFATLRVADLYASPDTKELRDLLARIAPNYQEQIRQAVGLGIDEIDRATVLFPTEARGKPVVVVTAARAFDQEKIRQALHLREQEKRLNGKTFYAAPGKGDYGLCFVSERVLVAAPAPELEKILKDGPRTSKDGPLGNALTLAAGGHQLVVGLNLAHPLFQKAAASLPREAGFLAPLFAARRGELTVVSDSETQATLRLVYADDAQAGKAREALEQARRLALDRLGSETQDLERKIKDPRLDPTGGFILQKALTLMTQAKEGIRGATVETPGGGQVVVSLKLKASAGSALTALGGAGTYLFMAGPARVEPNRAVARPSPPNNPAPPARP